MKPAKVEESKLLTCTFCPATAKDTSKERGRFKRRHPKLCKERDTARVEQAVFTQQLADGVKCVDEGEVSNAG